MKNAINLDSHTLMPNTKPQRYNFHLREADSVRLDWLFSLFSCSSKWKCVLMTDLEDRRVAPWRSFARELSSKGRFVMEWSMKRFSTRLFHGVHFIGLSYKTAGFNFNFYISWHWCRSDIHTQTFSLFNYLYHLRFYCFILNVFLFHLIENFFISLLKIIESNRITDIE